MDFYIYFNVCESKDKLELPKSTNQVIDIFEMFFKEQEKAMFQSSFKVGRSLESLKNAKNKL